MRVSDYIAHKLIKTDIEGAEPDALLGTRKLISEHLPGLAISIYHRPEHLWQIPLLVYQIAGNQYQHYLRSHAFSDFDIVLYAFNRATSSHTG